MNSLPLNADSNVEFAGAVALLVALLLPFCVFAVVDTRKILMVRRERAEGLVPMERIDGRAVKSGSRLVVWTLLLSLGVVALIRLLFGGFIAVKYDDEQIQLDYRFQRQPVRVPWDEATSIRLLQGKRTYRRPRTWQHIEIKCDGGPTYTSFSASSKEGRKLMLEAAKQLRAAERAHEKEGKP